MCGIVYEKNAKGTIIIANHSPITLATNINPIDKKIKNPIKFTTDARIVINMNDPAPTPLPLSPLEYTPEFCESVSPAGSATFMLLAFSIIL